MTTIDYFTVPILIIAAYIPGTLLVVLFSTMRTTVEKPMQIFSAIGLIVSPISFAAVKFLGTHNGFWLVASIQILATEYILGKYIWKKLSPKVNTLMYAGCLPITMLDILVLVVVIAIYWLIANAMGI